MRHTIRASLLVAMLGLTPSVVFGHSFAQGLAAYYIADYSTALEHFRPLAAEGNPFAQYSLGAMYALGQGVDQSYQEAAAWYRRAAEQGDAYAQSNLGVMYSQGQGMDRNPVIAYTLTVLAAERGHEMALRNREISRQALSDEQAEEGERLAAEWRVGEPLPTSSDVTTWP